MELAQRRLAWCRACAAFFLSVFVIAGQGQAAVPPPVAIILKAAETPSAQTLHDAETAWHGLGAKPGVTATYAMALAYVSNNRYETAASLLKELAEQHRKQPNIRRIVLWLAVAKTEKDTDLLNKELDQIADSLLAKSKGKPEAITSDDLETAGFFGQMLVFLERVGINSARVTPQRVGQQRIKLEKGLAPPLQAAMSDKMKTVTDQIDKQVAEFNKARAAWRKLRERDIEELEAELKVLKSDVETAQTVAKKARDDYEAACRPHQARWSQLKGDAARLNTEIDKIDKMQPTSPKPDPKTGKAAPQDEQKYRKDQADYDRERRRLPGLTQDRDSVRREIQSIDNLVAPQLQAATGAAAALKPKQDEVDDTQVRIDRKTKDLQRGTGWQGPAAKTAFEAITTYHILSVADEIKRIEAAYGK